MNKETTIQAASDLNTAVAAVMGEVRSLAKEDKNAHGGYTFAGIDAFLDLTRPLCAKHGLTIRQDEDGFEVIEVPSKNGPQKMLLMRFAFSLVCGNECDGPYRRSIMVPASMGSQAFGAAQSYTLKQFLRSLFQISTGEKGEDIDAHNTGELGTYTPAKSPDTGEPTGRSKPVKLEGYYTSKSALMGAVRMVVHQCSGFSDLGEFLAFVKTEEAAEAIKQCKRDLPDWYFGGSSVTADHEPLEVFLHRRKRELEQMEEDIARNNPVLAG